MRKIASSAAALGAAVSLAALTPAHATMDYLQVIYSTPGPSADSHTNLFVFNPAQITLSSSSGSTSSYTIPHSGLTFGLVDNSNGSDQFSLDYINLNVSTTLPTFIIGLSGPSSNLSGTGLSDLFQTFNSFRNNTTWDTQDAFQIIDSISADGNSASYTLYNIDSIVVNPLVVPIPEPSTNRVASLAALAGGLVMLRRRQIPSPTL